MPLTQKLIDALTPEKLPEDDDKLEKTEPPSKRDRRLAWTRFLGSQNLDEITDPKIENTLRKEGILPWHVGFGLVPTNGLTIEGPDYMMPAIEESGYTWGFVFFIPAFQRARVLQSVLNFEYSTFPVIAVPVEMQLHNLALNSQRNSALASVATWASAKRTYFSAASAQGLLTARHVATRSGQNSFWSQTAGSTFSVYRIGSNYVDASYLNGNWGQVSPTKRTPKLIRNMAAGDTCTRDGAVSSGPAYITHLPYPRYIGGGTGAHIILDRAGQSGDSGGLVHDNGDLISMYLGTAPVGNGIVEGISIALEQVIYDLDIELYV